MEEKNKIEYLVADTGAFIQNKSLQDIAEHVITCQKVVDEVKNKRQLKRLAVLPYELEVKDVFPENIKFVHDIAKQTGDYRSLSATDIEVIALTYQLEKEKVGSEHLKDKAEMQRSISLINHSSVELKDIAGFYLPGKNSVKEENLSEKLQQLNCDENDKAENEDTSALNGKTSNPLDSDQSDGESELHSDVEDQKESTTRCIDDLSLPASVLNLEENCNDNYPDNVKVDDILVKVPTNVGQECHSGELSDNNSEESYDDDDEDDDEDNDDDDDEGWITPANLKQAKIDMDQVDYDNDYAKVACITTDFAMQNVLKQIGLKVASLDGRIIKQIRTYIFRCYGCFKTTDDMTKVFCPSCGHNTLKRVSVTLEPDGTQKIHINVKRPLTMRGRKFKLPLFQGGKHSNNPIVTADQRVPDQKPSRVARTKTNILESDFIEGYSPFAVRDTTSRSAVLGIREQKQMRRPNLYKPRSNKKK